ncbi:MAG: hypothetical protein GYA30_12545 [Chloroflexi bacterium]|nr:hypothetical protein [Chloroflexota bacterium]OQB01786.1 MAG: hypothetical protein BWY25_00912 [Chloroflexi bacterium ADurb.Bin222]HOC20496.1 hypothetical protein [Anaerolineae bacterium]HQJ11245.1 hypothetical protein [Anaerolineae bacterium]HQM13405.1 hypothetical protein [Anaerolineae bacterium]
MELITYIIAAVLAFFGLMFVVGMEGEVIRLVIGLILMAGAGVMIYLTKVRPRHQETTVIQKIDLSGDVSLEQMRCRSCNGALSQDALEVRAGAIFVHCPYCGTTYQIEEAPKW